MIVLTVPAVEDPGGAVPHLGGDHHAVLGRGGERLAAGRLAPRQHRPGTVIAADRLTRVPHLKLKQELP